MEPRSSTVVLDIDARSARFDVLLWSAASGLVRWTVMDETDGKTIAQGEESGARLLARGRKFVVCDERQSMARVHSTGTEESHQVATPGRCTQMVIDDDTIYAMKGQEKEPDQIEAFGMTDGARRWIQKVPVQVGAIVHGPWLVVPSDGGMVRALRRDTGELAWSNGVGERATLSSFDESTILASGNRTITALRTASTLPPERTSEITIHVTSWGCVDKENATIFVGDVAAQSDGADRYTARVRGRGRVLVRASPWGDILPSHDEQSEWSYGPVLVELDGARHAMDVELDSCDED